MVEKFNFDIQENDEVALHIDDYIKMQRGTMEHSHRRKQDETKIKILCRYKKEIKYCLDQRRKYYYSSVFPVLEDLLQHRFLEIPGMIYCVYVSS
jgi:hypothetical protein